MKNGVTFFIMLIIGLYIATIYLNKKTIDNYSSISERDKNLNNLRGLFWSSYITSTVITIYLLIKLYSKKGFYYNKSAFVITILILLLNTGLIMHEEYTIKELLLKINTKHNLDDMYTIPTIMTVVNIISLLALMYTNKEENGTIKPTQNIMYENVFQNRTTPYIDPSSLLPPKRKIKNVEKIRRKLAAVYIDPSLLQKKQSEAYVNQLLL